MSVTLIVEQSGVVDLHTLYFTSFEILALHTFFLTI